jgi:hypothetical protein
MHWVNSEMIGLPQMAQRLPQSMLILAAQAEHRGQARFASTGPSQTTQRKGAIHAKIEVRA